MHTPAALIECALERMTNMQWSGHTSSTRDVRAASAITQEGGVAVEATSPFAHLLLLWLIIPSIGIENKRSFSRKSLLV